MVSLDDAVPVEQETSGDVYEQEAPPIRKLTMPLQIFCFFLFISSIIGMGSAGNLTQNLTRIGRGNNSQYIMLALFSLTLCWIYFITSYVIFSRKDSGISWAWFSLIAESVVWFFSFVASNNPAIIILFIVKTLPWILYFAYSKKVKNLYDGTEPIVHSWTGFMFRGFFALIGVVLAFGTVGIVGDILK